MTRVVVVWDGIEGRYAYAPPRKYIELASDGEPTPTAPWRDPRIDPQPGDVLRNLEEQIGAHRYYEVVEHDPRNGAPDVCYFDVYDGTDRYVWFAEWREQMRDAEVLVVVPESKEPAKEQSQPKGNDAK